MAFVGTIVNVHERNCGHIGSALQVKAKAPGRHRRSKSAEIVEVANDRSTKSGKDEDFLLRSGTLEIKLSKGTLRIAGAVDVAALRAAIECMVG